MTKNKNVIEDTLIQITKLEESLNQNAQGILASTMREEISNLVKESLKEQDEVDDEEVDVEETDTDNFDEMGDEEVEDIEGDVDFEEEPMAELPMDSDEEDDDVIDMTQASDTELIKVFKAMDANDGIIVQKDNNMLSIKDNDTDSEYIVQLSESDFDFDEDEDDFDFEDLDMHDIDMGIKDKGMLNRDSRKHKFDRRKDDFEDDFDFEEFTEGVLSSIEDKGEQNENIYELELEDEDDFNEMLENIYELELEDEDEDEGGDSIEDELAFEFDESDEIMESKKAKGMGMGKASKFKYSKKPNQEGGFKTVKRNANKTMGTGKPKYDWKEEVNMKGFGEKVEGKKTETKEASRTLGSGKRFGRKGLDKPKAAPRNLRKESIDREVNILREKNEEYKNALNLFRNKLNEVAIFNSNLAYATRLFTEHSTTKQEKINILRRFDNVETLKESKTLYKVIKSELSSEKPIENTITESIQRTVEKTPSTGSAVNLIESKTYENPQFLRMKDLMTKIK